MEKPKHEYYIKFSGQKFEMPKALDYKDFTIATRGTVTDISKKDNDDGTFKFIHTYKPYYIAVTDEHDKVYVKADKRSKSKRQRFGIINLNDTGMDDQDYYDMVMDKIYAKLPEIVKGVL
jgi:hypothetical protein